MNDLPPAGWNTDPDDPTQYRYWDGRQWTDHRAPKSEDAPAEAPSDRPLWKSPWFLGAAALILIIMFASMGDSGQEDPVSAPVETSAPEQSDPEDEPTPDAPAEPATLEDRLADAVGSSNRGINPRLTVAENTADDGGVELVVTWAINDNLTENMIKRGAQMDAVEILQAIAESPDVEYDQVFLVGTFSMVDQLGNAEESDVIGATYPRETIERINFDNFLTENAWAVANQDSLFVHPAFRPGD